MKKVSLIIPVFNAEKYLRRCLDSAVNQTYENMEIICVDDGSTDGSKQIIEEYAKNDKRIITIYQENKGESSARNEGLRIAGGDYIGFMDCDDWIENDMYESLAEALERENADMAAAGWYKETREESIPIKNDKPVEKGIFGNRQLLRYLYERDSYRGFAYIWDKLYKRKLLLDKDGGLIVFDEELKLGGDVLFLAQIALNTESAVYIDRHFYHYFQREDSGCHSLDADRRIDWVQAYVMVIGMFEDENVDREILDLVKRFLVYTSSNAAVLAFTQKNERILRDCQDIMRKYKDEYIRLNKHRPERIQRFEEIIQYKLKRDADSEIVR